MVNDGHARRAGRVLGLAVFLVASASPAALGCNGSDADTSTPLDVGTSAPALTATAHDGTAIDLRRLGKPAVVYFYPKDETPGCTAEACAFRDAWDRYENRGVLVIGVSADTIGSHRAFAKEHALPFPLVADPSLTWAHAFGVETTLGMTHRVSFLLDDKGTVVKVYPKVNPGIHADQILDDALGL